MAEVSMKSGADPKEAEANMKKCLGILRSMFPRKDHISLGMGYQFLGEIYMFMKKYDQAILEFTNALAIKKKLLNDDSDLSYITTLKSLSEGLRKIGRYSESMAIDK